MSSPPTMLQRVLESPEQPRRPTPIDALDLARRTFLAGRRVDMNKLAHELGISRVTLYRWVGTREQLLTEVLWSLTDELLTAGAARSEARQDTGSRAAVVLSGFVRIILDDAGMRRFLEDEADFALSLLTTKASQFQARIIGRIRELLDADVAARRLSSPIPLDDLAYTIVRVAESFVYSRAITGEAPDADRADRVINGLLAAR
jgi:AcrR family transcriptional regulator